MGNDKKLIETTAKITADKVISELKKQGLIKDGVRAPFQKTEQLLYNYNNFKAAIKDKYDQIDTIKSMGMPRKSSSITSFPGNASYENKSDADKCEERIEDIEKSIQITKNYIKIIEAAICNLKDDTYFDIIRMKYFEGESAEDIATHFEVDVSTVNRNKNRLINILQIRLFSDEVICQIFK